MGAAVEATEEIRKWVSKYYSNWFRKNMVGIFQNYFKSIVHQGKLD